MLRMDARPNPSCNATMRSGPHVAVISKPFTLDQVREAVRKLLA
jgi:hypothetical protein